MVMPRIEMLPEGYGIHPDDFDNGEVRYYIVDYVGVEIMVVHSIMFSKELVPYLAGSRQEIELSPKLKFIARIYVEN